MKVESFLRVTSQEDKLTVIKMEKIAAIRLANYNQVPKSFFVSLKDIDNLHKDFEMFNFLESESFAKYNYLPKTYKEELDNFGFSNYSVIDLFHYSLPNAFQVLDTAIDFDEDCIMRFDINQSLIYDLDKDTPKSIWSPLLRNSSLNSNNFDIEKAFQILSASPYAKKIEVKNNGFNERYIEVMVKPPQEVYDKLFDWFKVTKQSNIWGKLIKKALIFNPGNKFDGVIFDFFGLKEAYKGIL